LFVIEFYKQHCVDANTISSTNELQMSPYDTITDHVTIASGVASTSSNVIIITCVIVAMTMTLVAIALLLATIVQRKARRTKRSQIGNSLQPINIDSISSSTELSIDPSSTDLCYQRTDVISGQSRDSLVKHREYNNCRPIDRKFQ